MLISNLLKNIKKSPPVSGGDKYFRKRILITPEIQFVIEYLLFYPFAFK